MTTKRDAQEFEKRRLEAVALLNENVPQAEVARKVGVTRASVCRWAKTFGKHGEQGLRRKPRPGRPTKLEPRQREALLKLLSQGPQKMGYATQLWTAGRIRRVALERFGVSFHVNHVPKLLRQCGWSFQRPVGRAVERDEEATRRWITRDWPRIKKKPAGSALR